MFRDRDRELPARLAALGTDRGAQSRIILRATIDLEIGMTSDLRKTILSLLDEHRIMTIATVRRDGWPQATTVGYAHDGLTLYFLCGRDSQKAANIARDDRVSITIDHDTSDVMAITGLSMAAHAREVTDMQLGAKVLEMIMARYPEQTSPSIELPKPEDAFICEVRPAIISVLDYSKGFGHTDLMAC